MAMYYQDNGDTISKTQHAQDIVLVVLQSLGRISEKQENGPDIITLSPRPFQQIAATNGLWVRGTFKITLPISPMPQRHIA